MEWFIKGELQDTARRFLEDPEGITVPTIVMLETFKYLSREVGASAANQAAAYMWTASVVDLDGAVALLAAKLCAQHRLATADAIIYAHAAALGEPLVTFDHHFAALDQVVYFPKGGRRQH